MRFKARTEALLESTKAFSAANLISPKSISKYLNRFRFNALANQSKVKFARTYLKIA
jgi:hypothetical protein